MASHTSRAPALLLVTNMAAEDDSDIPGETFMELMQYLLCLASVNDSLRPENNLELL